MTSSLPPDAPKPRLCCVRKRSPEEEYGFNLHAEKLKGQFIGTVDATSPAEIAGLRPGDRIVAVNGVSVMKEPHKQLVARIKENALSCDLIVIDEEAQAWYNERNIPIPIDMDFVEIATVKKSISPPPDEPTTVTTVSTIQLVPSPSERNSVPTYATSVATTPRPPSYQEAIEEADVKKPTSAMRPRLCKLMKSTESIEFGFNLHADKKLGHFIGKIDPNSIAEHAGLEEGQRIVGVNGVLIYPDTPHKEVVSLIKANPLRSELLVASSDVDSYYKENNLEFDFANAERYAAMETVEQGVIGKGVANLTITNGYSANGDNGYTNGDRKEVADYSMSAYGRPQPQPSPPVEPYESVRDSPPRPKNPQQPEWMDLSAAQLRARVAQRHKQDPRTKQISLQEKHDFIRNL